MFGLDYKKNEKKKSINRRDFFKKFIRVGILGGLGYLGIVLLNKYKNKGTLKQSCKNNYICRGCDIVDSCVLPPALSFKRALKKKQV